MLASVVTTARPPGRCPTSFFAKSTIFCEMPPACMRLPAMMKNGTASSVNESTPFSICCATMIMGTFENATM